MKKKIVATTIAASLAVTAFAGIPLSGKGLAEKLGFSSIAYAATTQADALAKAKKLSEALAQVNNGVANVNAFRLQLKTALADGTVLAPVVDKLPSEARATFNAAVVDALSIDAGADVESELAQYRTQYNDFLKSLVPVDKSLTFNDVAAVAYELEAKLAGLSAEDLLLLDNETVRTIVKEAVQSNANVNGLVGVYNIAWSDFQAVFTNLKDNSNVTRPVAVQAFLALQQAYIIANTPTGGGSTGGGGSTIVNLPPAVVKLIDDVDAALKNATDAEKAAIIAKFVDDAQALIDTLLVVDASGNVVVANGQAVLQLPDADIVKIISGIAAIVDKVETLAPAAELSVGVIAFDLGNVTQDEFTINLSSPIVSAAIGAELTGAKFIVGEFEVTLPVGGTFNAAISLNVKKSEATSEAIGDYKAASPVYTFTLTVGGVSVTKFSKPISISIPLSNLEGMDVELLSIAKLVGGKLEFHGGRVKGGSLIEARDSFSSYVVVENKVSFSDIASVESWAGREISVIAAKGVIEGKSAGVFAPKDKVTRAEFAKMLIRGLDLENGSATEGFDDVKDGDWFAPYVAAAVEKGIINGRSATKFDPHATITRAEMAVMVSRALKATAGAADVTNINGALAGFSDAGQISAALKAGVAFAASEGIVKGSDGKFKPNDSATRAEAAVIIYRAVNFE